MGRLKCMGDCLTSKKEDGYTSTVSFGPPKFLNMRYLKLKSFKTHSFKDMSVEITLLYYLSNFKSGALLNVEHCITRALNSLCSACGCPGASVNCSRQRCEAVFHVECARKSKGIFTSHKVNKENQILIIFFLC